MSAVERALRDGDSACGLLDGCYSNALTNATSNPYTAKKRAQARQTKKGESGAKRIRRARGTRACARARRRTRSELDGGEEEHSRKERQAGEEQAPTWGEDEGRDGSDNRKKR